MSMIGLDVLIGGVSYKQYLEAIDVIWPCTTALPTATLRMNNSSGIFSRTNILNQTIVVKVMGNTIHNGQIQLATFSGEATAMGYGSTCTLSSTMGVELQYLYEGTIQAVGTNLFVTAFGNYKYGGFYTSLTSGLTSGTGYTSIAVNATNVYLPSGSIINLVNGNNNQTIITSSATSIGATTIDVNSFTANYSYPINSNVVTGYIPYIPTWVSAQSALLMDIGNIFSGLIHNAQPAQKTLGGTQCHGRLGYDVSGYGCINIDYTTGPLGLYVNGMWSVGSGQLGKQKTGIQILNDISTSNVEDSNATVQYIDWFIDPTQSPPLVNAFQRGTMPASGEVGFTLGTDGIRQYNLPYDLTDVKNILALFFNAESIYPNSGDDWSNYPTTAELQSQWSNTTTGGGTGSSYFTDTNTPYGQGWANHYQTGSNEGWILRSTFNLLDNGFQALSPTDALGNPRQISSINFMYATNIGANSVQVILEDPSGNLAASSIYSTSQGSFWQPVTIPIPSSGSSGWSITGTWDFSTTTIANVIFELSLTANPSGTSDTLLDYINFGDNYMYSPVYNLGDGTYPPNDQTVGEYDVSPSTGEITYDNQSIDAYGPRIYPYTDFYQPGLSDAQFQVAKNTLLSRRGKQSNGTVTIRGQNANIFAVKPGYKINLTIPGAIYKGATIDTTITDWIVEQIEYTYDARSQYGFEATFTVNPYYNTFTGVGSNTSPDSNMRNPRTKMRYNILLRDETSNGRLSQYATGNLIQPYVVINGATIPVQNTGNIAGVGIGK